MDLIDRKELIRQIQLQANRSSLGETVCRELSFGEMAGLIMDAPTVDAEPVRHGKWIWVKDHWECSECRESRFHNLVLGLDASFCGRCGAKMESK